MPNLPTFHTDAALTEAKHDVTLQEWCMRQSESDRRVELIGAFYNEQSALGAGPAPAAEFDLRFGRFAGRAV